MRVAFVGKGGSGKTTLAALTAQRLAGLGMPVLALDADINQNLAEALGAEAPASLSAHLPELKRYVRGDNPRIPEASEMIKTTPPGHGSRLLSFADAGAIAPSTQTEDGIRLMRAGEFDADDIGVRCYHAKTGAVELLLNHLLDQPQEWIVVDMTAGADAFASGLFTRFDLTVIVVEPTERSVGVYEQYRAQAEGFHVALCAVGNKARDAADAAFLRERLGANLLTIVPESGFVRSLDRGGRTGEPEPKVQIALHEIIARAKSSTRNWKRYRAQSIEFHLKNARSWANEELGADLAQQIDSEFNYSE